MNEVKRTQEKLEVDEQADALGYKTVRVADGTSNGDIDKQPVMTVYEEAKAAFIVEACNNYERVCASLLELVHLAEHGDADLDEDNWHPALEKAREALGEIYTKDRARKLGA